MAFSKIILNGVTQMDVTQDTVAADKLLTGYTATGADGEKITGTYSGGGGASPYTLITSAEYTVSTSSTSTTTLATIDTGVPSISDGTKIVYVRIRDKAGKRSGYFFGSDTFILNPNSYNGTTAAQTNTACIAIRVVSTGNYGVYNGKYGIFANAIQNGDNAGKIVLQTRYNSTYTLTINGTYKVEIFTLDNPGGGSIFL